MDTSRLALVLRRLALSPREVGAEVAQELNCLCGHFFSGERNDNC